MFAYGLLRHIILLLPLKIAGRGWLENQVSGSFLGFHEPIEPMRGQMASIVVLIEMRRLGVYCMPGRKLWFINWYHYMSILYPNEVFSATQITQVTRRAQHSNNTRVALILRYQIFFSFTTKSGTTILILIFILRQLHGILYISSASHAVYRP